MTRLPHDCIRLPVYTLEDIPERGSFLTAIPYLQGLIQNTLDLPDNPRQFTRPFTNPHLGGDPPVGVARAAPTAAAIMCAYSRAPGSSG